MDATAKAADMCMKGTREESHGRGAAAPAGEAPPSKPWATALPNTPPAIHATHELLPTAQLPLPAPQPTPARPPASPRPHAHTPPAPPPLTLTLVGLAPARRDDAHNVGHARRRQVPAARPPQPLCGLAQGRAGQRRAGARHDRQHQVHQDVRPGGAAGRGCVAAAVAACNRPHEGVGWGGADTGWAYAT